MRAQMGPLRADRGAVGSHLSCGCSLADLAAAKAKAKGTHLCAHACPK